MSEKKSEFIAIETVPDDYSFNVFGNSVDRKISKTNLFAQIKDESFSPFIYPTIELLQNADLEADEDNPTWVRCKETEYRLYQITNLAPGVDDIALDNGNTATYQLEYRDVGFVIGPDVSVAGSLAIFTDTGGAQLDDLLVPTNAGKALMQAADSASVMFPRKNADNTVSMLGASAYFDAIKQVSAVGYAGVIKTADNTAALAQSATDMALTPANLAALKASNSETLAGTDDTKYITSENLQVKIDDELSDKPTVIENVAALASTPVVAGRIYYLKEYNAGTGKGGRELVGKSGSATYDNVTKFAGSGGYFESINIIVSADHAGVVGGGVVDDYAAIQRYFNYIASTGYTFSNADLNGHTYFGARDTAFSSARVYAISDTIVIPTNYVNIDFFDAIFIPHPSFDLNKWAFSITGWIGKIKRISLGKFRNGIDLFNANLDIGRVVIDEIDAVGIDKLFRINCRSSQVTISNYRFDNVKIVAEIIDGDKVGFIDGWLSAGDMANVADAHFIVDSDNFAGLTLDNLFYVPTPQTQTRTSIVKITGTAARVTLKDCLCGGEPGQIPLVANYVTGLPGVVRGCHITIDNSMGFTTESGSAGGARPTVELYALPNSVVFQNFYGGSEETGAQGLVNFNTAVQTFAAAKAALGSAIFQLFINGRTPSNFFGISNSAYNTMAIYDRSLPATTRFLAESVTNTVGAVMLTKQEAGATVTYKVSLFSISNSGADRYSEYIISSDTANTPLSNWSIASIILGGSTFAGRLVVNGGGDIEIRNNSAASNTILAVITKLSNTRIS